MASVKKVLEREVNGLKVNLFEFDIESEESINEIKVYLVNKVKISKVHNVEEYDLTYYGSKNLNPDFVAKFNEQACDSVQDLQEDVQKAINDDDNRVSREILEYLHGIRNVKIQDDVLERIVSFLAQLIAGEKKDLADKIMFFPFLLRNNERIVSEMNIDDYGNFSLQGIKKENVENIILSFGKKFSDFSNEVYEETIGE